MFLGHYAVGLASKQWAPKASLGVLIAAPILLDLLWPIFLLVGWESVTIEHKTNPFLRLNFDSYPISHGLLAVIAWAILFASIYFGFSRYLQGAIVVCVSVISHWFLDYLVHIRDLPLLASDNRFFGLGLWNHRWYAIAVEVLTLALGAWLYLKQTKAKDKIGRYAFWAFIAFLLAVYAGVAFGPPPPSVKKLAIGTLFTAFLVPWAWWFDRHRELRATDDEPPVNTTAAGLSD